MRRARPGAGVHVRVLMCSRTLRFFCSLGNAFAFRGLGGEVLRKAVMQHDGLERALREAPYRFYEASWAAQRHLFFSVAKRKMEFRKNNLNKFGHV